MNTVDDIFNEFGGPTAVGKVLGKEPSTASEMKRRGSIPVEYWPQLIAAAQERGIELDYGRLVSIHVAERKAARHSA